MDAKPPQAVRDVFRKKKAVRDVDRSISWPLVKTRPAVVQSSRDRGHEPKGDGFHSIPFSLCVVALSLFTTTTACYMSLCHAIETYF
jgi:hypothetical protein